MTVVVTTEFDKSRLLVYNLDWSVHVDKSVWTYPVSHTTLVIEPLTHDVALRSAFVVTAVQLA